VALRDIAIGEEVTFNYGYDLEDYKEHPCGCGTRKCVGFIVAEEYFEHLLSRKTAAES
jgi:SET domain-containing protein